MLRVHFGFLKNVAGRGSAPRKENTMKKVQKKGYLEYKLHHKQKHSKAPSFNQEKRPNF